MPTWFIEGMADYVAFNSIVSLGLVSPQAIARRASVDGHPGWQRHAEVTVVGGPRRLPAGDRGCLQPLRPGDPTAGRRRRPGSSLVFPQLVGVGESWQDAFYSAFGVEVDEFYACSKPGCATRSSAPNRQPLAFQSTEPLDRDADAIIRQAPDSAAPGELITVIAQTEPSTRCTFTSTDGDGTEIDRESTYADPAGLIYWLNDIPVDPDDTPLTIAIDCGGHPDQVEIDLT